MEWNKDEKTKWKVARRGGKLFQENGNYKMEKNKAQENVEKNCRLIEDMYLFSVYKLLWSAIHCNLETNFKNTLYTYKCTNLISIHALKWKVPLPYFKQINNIHIGVAILNVLLKLYNPAYQHQCCP